jgi:penicillin amidase
MLNATEGKFVASHGSTLRAIYDFSQRNLSLFIISTGQSGHFLSQYYDDQSVLWQQEQYITLDNNKTFLDGAAPEIIFDPIGNDIN